MIGCVGPGPRAVGPCSRRPHGEPSAQVQHALWEEREGRFAYQISGPRMVFPCVEGVNKEGCGWRRKDMCGEFMA